MDQIELAEPDWTSDLEKEFMESLPSGVCVACGKAVYRNPRGRKKRFCSDECRFKWKNKHPQIKNWKSTRVAVCPECGKEFLATREYRVLRKYCSRACANRGRAKKKEVKEDEHGGDKERSDKPSQSLHVGKD